MQPIPQLNPALSRYARRRTAIRVVAAILFYAVWCVAALLFNQSRETFASMRLEGWRMVIWIFGGLVLTVLLFRLWRLITDRTVTGTILRADFSRSYSADEDAGTLRGFNADDRIKLRLKLRCRDGSVRRVRFEIKNGSYLYYAEGAEVTRYRGLPYPIRTVSDPAAGYVCVACGRIHKEPCGICENCGFPMLLPPDAEP